MTSRDFCYWLQGFFEIADSSKGFTNQQAYKIKQHLAMVFRHEIDPSFGHDNDDLDKLHGGGDDKLIRC